MASFDNLASEKLMPLAKLTNVGGNANMSRDQLESIFVTIPKPESSNRPASRPK